MYKNKKIIITSILGNVIEYYGFTVFAVFAAQIGQVFFPQYNLFLQILFAQMLFGSGFITRPIGSLVFGHFGDKIGRKKALSYTILGMSIVTFGIGAVPSHESIGNAAPILVLLLRLLQGFFVGGEGPGAALYMLEHAKGQKEGEVGGIVIASIAFGSFLAMLVGFIISNFYGINLFNWRLPFFMGGALGIIGLYLRFLLPETEAFLKVQKEKKILKVPIFDVIRFHGKPMLLVALLGGITTSVSYIVMAYVITHLRTQLKLSENITMLYSLYTVFIYVLMLLAMGRLSDIAKNKGIGFGTFINTFNVIIAILIVPIFYGMSSKSTLSLLASLSALTILAGGICAPAYPYVYKMFKTELRYTGVAVSYNLGITLLGGFTPAISTYLVNVTGLSYAPGFYIISLAVLYFSAKNLLKVQGA